VSLESDLKTLLGTLTDGRFYPDVPPDAPTFPLITYQQIAGRSLWLTERVMPGHKNARVQFNVWAATRVEANAIAAQIEALLCAARVVFPAVEPLGALTALYESAIKKYGTRQDFGIWYPDP